MELELVIICSLTLSAPIGYFPLKVIFVLYECTFMLYILEIPYNLYLTVECS
jgi:hypothetical protein